MRKKNIAILRSCGDYRRFFVERMEVHGVNARRLMYKLQTALCANGVRVRIDQRQHWSDKAGRMLTIYEARKDDGALLCKSYRAVDIVQALAEQLAGGGGDTG